MNLSKPMQLGVLVALVVVANVALAEQHGKSPMTDYRAHYAQANQWTGQQTSPNMMPGSVLPRSPMQGGVLPSSPMPGGMSPCPMQGGVLPSSPMQGGVLPSSPMPGGMSPCPMQGGVLPSSPMPGGMSPCPMQGGMSPGTGGMFGARVTPMMFLSVEDVRSYLALQLDRLNNKRLKIGDVNVDDGAITADIVTVDNSLVQRIKVDRRTGIIKYED